MSFAHAIREKSWPQRDEPVQSLTSPPVDFDLSQLGDDLLGQFFLSAWHGMSPFCFDTTRFSLWKWCRLRGAGQWHRSAAAVVVEFGELITIFGRGWALQTVNRPR